MKKTVLWKTVVIAVLGIAIIGVMQLKAKQTAPGDGDPHIAIATSSGEESSVPTSEPVENAAAPPPTDVTPATTPAAASNTATQPPGPTSGTVKETPKTDDTAAPPAPSNPAPVKKATFIELGADQCVPCKMMKPIMDELRQEYPDTLNIVFYDVWKDSKPAEKYGIRSIPTQILLNGDGKEIFRHVGFWPKEEIVAKFKELGIDL